MREPRTEIPTIITDELPSGGRIAYFAGDIGTVFGRWRIPDHGDLLVNAVQWCARDNLPLRIEGPGYLDCHLYRQDNRLILHIINLSGRRMWPGYVEEDLPVGPLQVTIPLPEDVPHPNEAVGKVSNQPFMMDNVARKVIFSIPSIQLHELVVLE
jgi:hypothetical protein